MLNMKERNKETKCVAQGKKNVCVFWVWMNARVTLPSPQILLCLKPLCSCSVTIATAASPVTLGIALTKQNKAEHAQLSWAAKRATTMTLTKGNARV